MDLLYGKKKAQKLPEDIEPEAKTEPVSLIKKSVVSGAAAFPAKPQMKQSIRETLKPASVRTKVSFWMLWPLVALASLLVIAGTVYALFEPSNTATAAMACFAIVFSWFIVMPLVDDAIKLLDQFRQNWVDHLITMSVGLMALVFLALIVNGANGLTTSDQHKLEQEQQTELRVKQTAAAKQVAVFAELDNQAKANQALITKQCKTDQGYAQQSKDFVAQKQTSWRAKPGSEGDLAAFAAALDSKASLIIASCKRKD